MPATALVVRDMVEGDIDEVVRIITLHDSDDGRYARGSFETGPPLGSDPHFQHVVCLAEDGRVIGVSGWGPDLGEGAGIYWLGWTYVNPWSRGQGVGARLLVTVIERVRALGGRKLFLETSSMDKYAEAVRFYERIGFVEEGRLHDFYGPGEAKILMGLPLSLPAAL